MAIIYTEPFASDPALWESADPEYTIPRDSAYPYVEAAFREAIITGGGGPAGEDFVRETGVNSYVAFGGYGPWDATCGRMWADIRFSSAQASSFSSSAFATIMSFKSSTDISGSGNINFQIRRTSVVGSVFNLDVRVRYSNGSNSSIVSTSINLDTWYTWKLLWQCGSNPVEILPGPGVPTVTADGTLELTRALAPGGTPTSLISLTGIALYVSPGTSWGGSFTALNFNDHAQVGTWGDYTNVTIESCEDEEPEPPDPVPTGTTNNSDPPCCQTAPPGSTSTGPVLPPVEFNLVLACDGGGQAPDTTPVTNSENWAV